MHEADHLRALDEAPRDWARRLAYAEWLEQRGDPRAELLRIEDTLRREPFGSPARGPGGKRWRECLGAFDRDWIARIRSDAVVPPWFSPIAAARSGVTEFFEWMTQNQWEWVIVACAAPLELMARALIESRCRSSPQTFQREGKWLPNAAVRPGREYEAVSHLVPLVQMRAQHWTIAIYRTFGFSLASEFSAREDARALSQHFGTIALEFAAEDTSNAVEYHLYECGQLVEFAEWSAGDGRFASLDRSRPSWTEFPPDYPDALFREFGLYVPPCYAADDDSVLAIDGPAASEIERADLVDLSGSFRVPEPEVLRTWPWPFTKVHALNGGTWFDLSQLATQLGGDGEDVREMPF